MKNTFMTPSAQQFGLWFFFYQVEETMKLDTWEDVNTSDSITYDSWKEIHSNEFEDDQRSSTINGKIPKNIC